MTILSAFAPPRDRRLLKGLMGRSFERLGSAVRDLHGTEQIGYWRGLCQVKRGPSILSAAAYRAAARRPTGWS